jgi:curli biogenesis system outer membrane secretion channel CsgG
MGKLLGVRYMITGKVTRFAYKKSGFSTGWGVRDLVGKVAPSVAGVAGDIHVSKASFTGRLDVRLIDVESGEVLLVSKDEGTIKDTSVKVAGTGADVQYDQELVNKIFEPVTEKIAKDVLKKIARILAEDNDKD